MIVYQILNKINGKKYIGQTTSKLSYRWAKHQKDSSRCTAIHNAIKKYGSENFEITILEHCDSLDELNEREIFYIKLMSTLSPNGYNLIGGGKNRAMSDETKDRLSKANRGNKNPHYGKPRSMKVKKAISEKASMRGSGGTLAAVTSRVKSILCIETGVIYGSISQASRDLSNVGTSNICKVLKGKMKHVKGYSFEYLGK